MNILTDSECCSCLVSVARNVTSTPPGQQGSRHCRFSDGSRKRKVLHRQLSLFHSSRGSDTRIRTSQSARKIQTMLALHRVDEDSLDQSFPELALHQVRGVTIQGLRTAPTARTTQNRNSHGSADAGIASTTRCVKYHWMKNEGLGVSVRSTNLFLAEFTKR